MCIYFVMHGVVIHIMLCCSERTSRRVAATAAASADDMSSYKDVIEISNIGLLHIDKIGAAVHDTIKLISKYAGINHHVCCRLLSAIWT